jgi:pimeloyl-ACP methyl ester carboxylesterase
MKSESSAGRTASINGMEMYYQLYGAGEALVLLHGFTGAGSDWRYVFDLDELAKSYRVIIPDMRGHGGSTNPAREFTHRQSARDIFALLEHLKIGKFKAIGLSGGGNTLLHMATEQAARVEAMVIISATTHFPDQARAIMGQFAFDNLSAEELAQMRARHQHGDEQIRGLFRHGNAFKDSYDDLNFSAADLGNITADTLIVYGDRDPLYPLSIATEMYAAIPQSSLMVIPNGGHSPIFGAARDYFVASARAFLRGDWKKK